MTNAELFKEVFGRYLTEVWAMPEDAFLEFATGENERPTVTIRRTNGCQNSQNSRCLILGAMNARRRTITDTECMTESASHTNSSPTELTERAVNHAEDELQTGNR